MTVRVADYMVTDVTTLDDDARLLDAALLIRRTSRRHIPIIDSDGKPIGIITDRDVQRMAPSMLGHVTAEEYNAIFEGTLVTRAMTHPAIVVTPDTPIEEAVEILHAKKIGALLVVQDGVLAGILTVTDMLGLLRDLIRQSRKMAKEAGDV
jgi:acetoin utilization protein AcuB